MAAAPILLARVAACASAIYPRARYLVTDFDGTCTTADTTPVVPHLAARASQNPSAVLERFNELEGLYLRMVEQCTSEVRAQGAVGPAAFDAAGLEAALASLDAVSDSVTDQLSESGILAGIDESGVGSALAEWAAAPDPPIRPPALRDGCASTLAAAAGEGWRLGVLTLNWCPPLVHAFLPVLAAAEARVWSNRIDASTGVVSNEVRGAAAKRAIIAALVSEAREAEPHGQVVYVGDSATDLLAMLEADLGILIGESQSTRRLARQFGLSIEPLPTTRDAAAADGVLPATPPATVWEAASWDDVRRCLELPAAS